ncbi:DUF2723 domain-containing protein [Longimicrobium sp.]|uniref:glycosyltransferase family 117 protein n=1 Tax=Longimicrobium sp. TaxID=2029185 RepID=UPI002BF5F5AB|nr:DUF2723 domain-containing protein [Longimicrobium sp.]HSU16078.1 DUF2723 domain-containing protein [Longimicrobium sp.]
MTQATKTERVRTAAPETPAVEAGPQRPPYLLALVAALAVFALYAFTLAPTTAFWDTSEYIATSHILGIPHPPGNPLFVLLSRAWDILLTPTGLPTAVRINLFSALMSAGTTFFWYLLVHRILGFFDSRETVRRVGAAVSVLVAATAYTVWNQSNVNEKVYTVSMFTIAAMSWLAFLWRDHVEEHRGVRGPSRFHDDNVLVLLVFMLALSVGNHLMAFLAAPALVLFIFVIRPRALANWRLYAFAAVFGFLGLSVHFFLSIRAGLHPIINEANPSCPSMGSAFLAILGFGNIKFPGACENLYAALAREQYAKPSIVFRQAPFWAQMANYFQYFDWQWARSLSGTNGYLGGGRISITLLFTALGGYGAFHHFKRDRKSFLYMGLLFFTLSVGLTIYMNFKYGFAQVQHLGLSAELSEVRERDYFFLVSFSLWGLWVGIGLTQLWLELAEAMGGGNRKLVPAAAIFALAFVPMALNWSYASRRGDYAARDLAYNLLQSVEPYGVLFTNGDNDTFPLWYAQEVEGVRRDVTVIVLSYLNTDWYPKQLRDLTSPCNGRNPASDPTRIICQRAYDPATSPRFYNGTRAPTRPILALSDAQILGTAQTPAIQVADTSTYFRARNIEVKLPQGAYVEPKERFVLEIIRNAWGDRPIFFASTTNEQYDLGLAPYVARQGLAFKLVTPEESRALQPMPTGRDFNPVLGAYYDIRQGQQLLDNVFQFHGLADKPHWADDATRNIPTHYFYAYEALASAQDLSGNRAAAQKYDTEGRKFEALARR